MNSLLYSLNILLIMQILRRLSISRNSETYLFIYRYLLNLKLIIVLNNEITIIGTNLLSELPGVIVVILIILLVNIVGFGCWNLLLVLVYELVLDILVAAFAFQLCVSYLVLGVWRDLESIVVYVYQFLRSLVHSHVLIIYLRTLILIKLHFDRLLLRSRKLMKLTLIPKKIKLVPKNIKPTLYSIVSWKEFSDCHEYRLVSWWTVFEEIQKRDSIINLVVGYCYRCHDYC